jgi:transcriptional regulator with XRE-family HTH domain
MLTPKILLEQRIKKGMSQEEVAKAIGVSQRSYSNYENGTRNPKIDKIIKLAKLLEIKLTLNTNVLNDKKNENKL